MTNLTTLDKPKVMRNLFCVVVAYKAKGILKS